VPADEPPKDITKPRSIYDASRTESENSRRTKTELETATARSPNSKIFKQREESADAADQSAPTKTSHRSRKRTARCGRASKSHRFLLEAHRQRKIPDDVQRARRPPHLERHTGAAADPPRLKIKAILGQQSAVKTQLKEFGSEIHDDAERPPYERDREARHTPSFHTNLSTTSSGQSRKELGAMVFSKKEIAEEPSRSRQKPGAQELDSPQQGITPSPWSKR